MKFANFLRYFMNKANKAISLQLTSQMFTTVPSHVREHIYILYYCSRSFPSCIRNLREVLNYMNNSFMKLVNCCVKATNLVI